MIILFKDKGQDHEGRSSLPPHRSKNGEKETRDCYLYGGFHVDGITGGQVREVLDAFEEMIRDI